MVNVVDIIKNNSLSMSTFRSPNYKILQYNTMLQSYDHLMIRFILFDYCNTIVIQWVTLSFRNTKV